MIVTILLECGGTLLVVFGLREVFRDIFHPTASGSLSEFVGWLASLLMRHTRLRPAVGPLSLLAVIRCWVILLAVGFALIYCGILPSEIAAPASESYSFAQNFLRSLYFLAWSLRYLPDLQSFPPDKLVAPRHFNRRIDRDLHDYGERLMACASLSRAGAHVRCSRSSPSGASAASGACAG